MTVIKGQTARLLLALDVLKMAYHRRYQGVIYSAGSWYLTQTEDGVSGAGGRETTHIAKFTSRGEYVGKMTALGAGHGSVFAMDGSNVLLGWDSSNGNRYVRRFPWQKGATLKESQAPLLGTGTDDCYPLPLDGDYLTLAVRNNTYMWFYQRLYSSPATTIRTIRVPVYVAPKNSRGPAMQGAFSFGQNVFVQWGWPEDRPLLMQQYQWGALGSTINYKAPLSTLDITKIGFTSSDTSTEPEGIAAYNGRLIIGKQFNGEKRRAFRVFLFDGIKREGVNPKPPPPPVIRPWPPVPPPITPPVDKCQPVVGPVTSEWLEPILID